MQNYNSKLKSDKTYDIKVRAYKFALSIMSLVDSLPDKRSCWIIADQLLRASTSVGANIIEAQAASSKRDFVNFMTHSLKSANECKFWLGLLRDGNILASVKINPQLEETKEIANILATIVLKAKGKNRYV